MFGIMGVLSAGPVADGIAFILAAIFLIKEVKGLKANVNANEIVKEETKQNSTTDKQIVITISREYGSGGSI